MNDLTIEIINGLGGRRTPDTDSVSGLLASSDVAGGVAMNAPFMLTSTDDANALGIDADYDIDNSVVVYEHIQEFFRLQPNGTLYVNLVPQTVTYANMLALSGTSYVKNLLTFAQGQINQLAVAYNPVEDIVDTSALEAAIPVAQALYAYCFQKHMPLHVILEGTGIDITAPVQLHGLNSGGVSVVAGQAEDSVNYNGHAAVGTGLGTVALAKVNENIAWVQKFNLMGGVVTNFRLGGVAASQLTDAQIEAANTAGLIFFVRHIGKEGIYWNDSFAATALTNDIAYIEDSRTANKAARLIRTALLPQLNGPVTMDPSTGQIAASSISYLERLGNKAILPMFTAAEISGPDPSGATPPFTIDPNQDVLGTGEIVGVLRLVRTGTSRQLRVSIGFPNPQSQS